VGRGRRRRSGAGVIRVGNERVGHLQNDPGVEPVDLGYDSIPARPAPGEEKRRTEAHGG